MAMSPETRREVRRSAVKAMIRKCLRHNLRTIDLNVDLLSNISLSKILVDKTLDGKQSSIIRNLELWKVN